MSRYTVTVNATSNIIPNTEDTFVEIYLPNTIVRIKRVSVRLGGGPNLAVAGVDNDYQVRLVRKTQRGTGGVSAEEVRKQKSNVVSQTFSIVKEGPIAFSTVTLGDIIDVAIKNGRETFEWIATDDDDTIATYPLTALGNIFAVLIKSAVTLQQFQVTVEWEE